ncbi:hypothetical protein GMORB2_3731 [Geosmithia morbida]|uniref:Uncharacterized protein n=1 Tax=Geosmithia morbida TaxID=1094350 RepID=A0A9P5D3F7_9HYPO|nr:uncharacterized protein GMORB2_3731 [Geosmithia morbida]KAF4124892.1 hypothetical protein GMORB2_3731 [Geosmithia morbida]
MCYMRCARCFLCTGILTWAVDTCPEVIKAKEGASLRRWGMGAFDAASYVLRPGCPGLEEAGAFFAFSHACPRCERFPNFLTPFTLEYMFARFLADIPFHYPENEPYWVQWHHRQMASATRRHNGLAIAQEKLQQITMDQLKEEKEREQEQQEDRKRRIQEQYAALAEGQRKQLQRQHHERLLDEQERRRWALIQPQIHIPGLAEQLEEIHGPEVYGSEGQGLGREDSEGQGSDGQTTSSRGRSLERRPPFIRSRSPKRRLLSPRDQSPHDQSSRQPEVAQDQEDIQMSDAQILDEPGSHARIPDLQLAEGQELQPHPVFQLPVIQLPHEPALQPQQRARPTEARIPQGLLQRPSQVVIQPGPVLWQLAQTGPGESTSHQPENQASQDDDGREQDQEGHTDEHEQRPPQNEKAGGPSKQAQSQEGSAGSTEVVMDDSAPAPIEEPADSTQ